MTTLTKKATTPQSQLMALGVRELLIFRRVINWQKTGTLAREHGGS
ncbi:hypothetical protein CH64_720 [Yersinia rohdei]|uniref:Uncharacterized protein n=1 Tax=Yersinia rohdei TaxID=29485 RepID=A0ABM5SAR0_YERRO|nr:hypothetical protein CH64_720 [Yersinia rohdei]